MFYRAIQEIKVALFFSEHGVEHCQRNAVSQWYKRWARCNTKFQQKDCRKWTWRSNDGKTRNMIDMILIRRKWATSVQQCRTFQGADIDSDHSLVMALSLQPFRFVCSGRFSYLIAFLSIFPVCQFATVSFLLQDSKKLENEERKLEPKSEGNLHPILTLDLGAQKPLSAKITRSSSFDHFVKPGRLVQASYHAHKTKIKFMQFCFLTGNLDTVDNLKMEAPE